VREIHDHAEQVVEGDPRSVFETISDIQRLAEWNGAIERVIDWPDLLAPGAHWTVEMHPSRMVRWKSVSTLREFDPERRRFAYRTVNADGNPSYALWQWEVAPLQIGTKVSVRWDVYLETLDRRFLAGPIRKRQLRREVAASLKALTYSNIG
jgi:hypothetical protein